MTNFNEISKSIPTNVKLIVVSKLRNETEILEVYNIGHKIFGENKVQELVPKYNDLPKDIQWHLIGHLQTNKVKYIAPFVSMIHSVDSLKLLKEINKQALKNNRIIDCLLQMYIAEEETKFGMDTMELETLLNDTEFKSLNNIRICGLMGMATFTDNQTQVRKEFAGLYKTFLSIKQKYFQDNSDFKELSMGMTDDYLIAIEEGSTMVRIGTAIFGER
jgi:PLP dependent protein